MLIIFCFLQEGIRLALVSCYFMGIFDEIYLDEAKLFSFRTELEVKTCEMSDVNRNRFTHWKVFN